MNTTISKWAAVSVCGLLGAWSDSAAAQEGAKDCSAVYDAAHEAERSGDLHTALEYYQSCAADSCESPVRWHCEARAMRLEMDAPSVVPLAKTASGEPIVEAEVTMDGKPLASRLDGHAIAVDPGLHEFVFSVHGEVFGNVRLVIAQGQRNRELMMSLPQPVAAKAIPAPRAATASSSVNVTPWILGGTALLGGGAYALLSTWARNDNAQLARCSPNCPKDSVQHIRTLYTAANISLGVGVAAAIGSVASLLLSNSGAEDKPAPSRKFALSVQPSRTGALATFRGTL